MRGGFVLGIAGTTIIDLSNVKDFMKTLTKLSAAVLASATAITSCMLIACGGDSDSSSNSESNVAQGKVKNLILMIGDGMGAQQVG